MKKLTERRHRMMMSFNTSMPFGDLDTAEELVDSGMLQPSYEPTIPKGQSYIRFFS
jgi:hypothetical protein